MNEIWLCRRRHRRHPGWCVLAVAVCSGLCGATATFADGLTPSLPYRYLRPPAALKALNRPPLSGTKVLPSDYMRSVVTWEVFTDDGQAGISGSKGALRIDTSASAVTIRLTPVPVPSGLPPQVTNDGNAYRVTVTEQPGSRPVQIAQAVNITLRWPHMPVAIYAYRSGSWRQVCYSSQAFLTGQTITCHSAQLGTFVAVAPASGTTTQPVSTPSQTGSSTRWIPLIALSAVVVLAAIGAFFMTRSRRPKRSAR